MAELEKVGTFLARELLKGWQLAVLRVQETGAMVQVTGNPELVMRYRLAQAYSKGYQDSMRIPSLVFNSLDHDHPVWEATFDPDTIIWDDDERRRNAIAQALAEEATPDMVEEISQHLTREQE